MSPLLTEPLDEYLDFFVYETHGNETPYLFHPTNDTTRVLPSSQWSAVVKACFKKHSPNHVAPPPKVRSSVSYSPRALSRTRAVAAPESILHYVAQRQYRRAGRTQGA